MSLWVGPHKCGKSFLMLHIAYLLSLGRSVFGLRVRPTKVLYVAAEGEGGIVNRIKALRDKYGP
jgi:RecA-family ATPase